MYIGNWAKTTQRKFNELSYEIKHSKQNLAVLIRYAIAGVFVGIFYVIIGYVLSNWFEFSVPISVTLSYLLTTPVAFILQKTFTFKSARALSQELPRFILVGAMLLILSSAANKYVVLPIPLILNIVIFWLISSILNFLAYKFWVFGGGAQ